MQSLVQSKFTSITPAKRGELVSSVHRYVSNNQFGNIIQNIDINNVDKDRNNISRPGNLYNVCKQLTAFDSVPGLLPEVRAWLNSV
jgi:hypothetical protein